jgi:hypothetical protein
MPRIYWIEHSWAPYSVPTEAEYHSLRSFNQQQFESFLKEKQAALRTHLHSQNPYQWSTVWKMLGIGSLLFLTSVWVEREIIVFSGFVLWLFAGMRTFSTVGSRDYSKAFRAQRKYLSACLEASKVYDYPRFTSFVQTQLLQSL